MLFSSLEFLFLYLPVTLVLYFISPKKLRNTALLLMSLIFYGLGEPKYLPLLLAVTLLDYSLGWLIFVVSDRRVAKILLFSAVAVNVILLSWFKYGGDLLSVFSIERTIDLPMGISFYVFQGLSYVADVYMGKAEAEKNPIDFAAYITLFPQLVAGPIVKYTDISRELREERRVSSVALASGARLFICGLGKKVLIANPSGEMWQRFTDGSTVTFLGGWIAVVFFALQIYYDFSGYTDMARGLGKIFGFEFPENFNYPYISKSITEFWRRWHITLSSWFREYVYIPLGGNRRGRARTVVNLFVTWLLTGLWHGSGIGFICWGLYFFLILLIEKFLLSNFLEKIPAFFARIYTLVLVLVGWLIFASSDLASEQISLMLRGMFTLKGGFLDSRTEYEILRNIPFLTIAFVGSTPIVNKLRKKLMSRNGFFPYVFDLGAIGVLLLSIAYLLNSGYNPFLYFRF